MVTTRCNYQSVMIRKQASHILNANGRDCSSKRTSFYDELGFDDGKQELQSSTYHILLTRAVEHFWMIQPKTVVYDVLES